jgi:hypothetical protein
MLGTATGFCGVDRGRSVALLGFELCLLLLRGGEILAFGARWAEIGPGWQLSLSGQLLILSHI